MGRPAKAVDDIVLQRMVEQGMSLERMAAKLGVSRNTVKARLDHLAPAAVARPLTAQVAGASMWDTQEALQANYQRCLKLLQEAQETGVEVRDRNRILAEIRNHLEAGVRVAQVLYDTQRTEAFMATVLDVIGGCDPELRAEILRRLDEQRSVRLAFGGSRA